MKTHILLAAAVVAMTAGAGVLAAAQPPAGGPGIQRHAPGPRGGHGPRVDLGLRGLDLTEAQREQVEAIVTSHQPRLTETAQKVGEAQRAFHESAAAPSLDEAAIRAQGTALGAALAEQALVHARVRAEVHGLLTAEQLQTLKERREAAAKRMEERQQRLQERRQQRQQRPPQQ